MSPTIVDGTAVIGITVVALRRHRGTTSTDLMDDEMAAGRAGMTSVLV